MLTRTIDTDGIAVVTIDMPGRSMNVIDWALVRALDAEIAALAADPAVTGIVLTSGKAAFIAGADLAVVQAVAPAGATARDVADAVAAIGDCFRRIERCGKPVVAAATGTALGGGLELMLACHYRIASDAKGAVFGLPEVKLGLLPGAGGTQRLPRLIGIEAALPLLVEGKALSAAEALKLGILHEVVPAAELLAAARRVLAEGKVSPVAKWDEKRFTFPGAAPISGRALDAFSLLNARVQGATRHNYPAPRAILSCVFEGSRLPIDKALKLEQKYFGSLFGTPVPVAMIRTLFFAKQAADKLARRPAGVPKGKVARLGVLGAGFMGRGIAEVSALAGMDVVILDRDLASAEAARATILAALDASVAKGRLDAGRRDAAAARIVPAGSYDALAACDLVIEAVFEDRALKADVIAKAEAAMLPDAVLASNTSSLPIDGLAKASGRPQQMVGLHFFSPVPRMALVEVIAGSATTDATLALALDYVAQIRKTPIVVNDAYGFYTTRCVDAFIREGARLLKEGVPPAVIENVAVTLGMPVGPLALADEIGIDVMHHIKEEAKVEYGSAYVADASDAVLDVMQQLGRFGRKAKGGFYSYDPAGKALWEGARSAVGVGAADVPPADVKARLLHIQVVTAAVAFAEGIVTDPAEADLGAVLAWAFPSYLGGPFSVMESAGLPAFVAEADRLAAAYGARFAPPAKVRDMAARGARFFAAPVVEAAE